MSTPAVGSQSSKDPGVTAQAARHDTFCWLPPLSVEIGESPPAVTMPRRSVQRWTSSRSAFLSTRKRLLRPVQHRQRDVLADRELRNDRLALPIRRHDRQTKLLGVLDLVPLARALRQPDPAADAVARAAGEHVRKLERACARESGDAEDLAFVNVEVDAPEPAALDVARLEHDRRVGALRHRRPVVRVHVGADHQVGQPARVGLFDRDGGHQASAPEHRDAIGEMEDLVHPVRHVEHRGPGLLDLFDDGEQTGDFLRREHRGGLVQNEHATAAFPTLERRRDRDHCALDRRRLSERAMNVEIDGEARQDPIRLGLLLAPEDPATGAAGEPP